MLDRVDGRQTIWGEVAVSDLKRLWSLGLTGTQIAEQIPGSTRCSVLGKAHRLDLPVRASLTARTPRPPQWWKRPPKIRVAKPKTKPTRAAPRVFAFRAQIPIRKKAEPPEFLGLELLALDRNACRYPHGEGPHFFCGQPSEPTSSYCSYHARKCFQVQS